ncbi:hypothetical protein J5N58_25830 [Rhizobium cremeum]|uniref:hypothetical protein n=1 Tax=Rhizobium cremeum TaxID=2813827 RepID=UPI001FD12357|nr:hypothetical protein [Rhizobium cremeum]MCJ7997995.1 hypothetical protein [Rhizobium cremeum]MCJ8003101.1 hypothetical protein [Rhizobium cremeum]
MRPHRQGELDALCGIYALINGFAHAARADPIAYFPKKKLFTHLIERATEWRGDASFICDGLSHEEMRYLVKQAVRFIDRKGHAFSTTSARKLLTHPFTKHGDGNARRGWLKEAAELTSCAVILDINTPWLSHWSVLADVEGKRVNLFDSMGMRTVDAEACKPFLVLHRL